MIESDRICSAAVEMKQTEDHGMVLVSTKSLEPGPLGLIVFRETALLSIRTRGSSLDESGPVPDYLAEGPQMWTDWWYFQQQPKDIRDRILKMYQETDCSQADAIRQHLNETVEKKQGQHRECEGTKLDEDDSRRDDVLQNIEDFIKLAMVIRFNGVELCPPSDDGLGPGTDYGFGLFEVACKMSHSCRPNCAWMTEPDGASKQIRAITKIQAGEELTVDYIGQPLSPTHERREELLHSKGFLCNCVRCSNILGDDTRRFPCMCQSTTTCQGVHLVHQQLASSIPRLLPCSVCNNLATDDYTERMLEEESRLQKVIEEIKLVADEGGNGYQLQSMTKQIEELNPPHSCHSLAEKCYQLQSDYYNQVGEYKLAAEACYKQIGCRVGILGEGHLCQGTAFCNERLGDVLQYVNVEEAEEAYKRSVRELLVMRGGAPDPYSKCALSKLLNVQSTRIRIELDHLPHDRCLKGIADAPYSAPYPCVVCGNGCTVLGEKLEGARYCCEEHQQMHLSMVGRWETPQA
ncbi:unnamed protein product [Cylindrotheca closterium]|uniref:SET domain-containing protein n=1 Tax=Cylindrotheca closterium TaxID=2856 RepID=A0AAD2GBK4_9STRA|nr:unnamed protein product [Cylindrotheca closterium]